MRAKIILRVVAIVTALLIALLLLGGWLLGPKVKSISSQPRYAQMLSKHYRLKVDCYIVRSLTSSPERILLVWPGRRRSGLPEPVSKTNIGYRTPDDEIIDVASKGTTFVLKDVVERKTFDDTFHIFLVVLDSDRSATPRVLDALWLTALGTPTNFKNDLVEELSDDKKFPNGTQR
jgi:hypothetical protein